MIDPFKVIWLPFAVSVIALIWSYWPRQQGCQVYLFKGVTYKTVAYFIIVFVWAVSVFFWGFVSFIKTLVV